MYNNVNMAECKAREKDTWGCCALIFDKEKRILLCQRSLKESEPGTWRLPGGKIQPGECAYDAIAREVKEETSLSVKDPFYIGCFRDGKWLDFVFIIDQFDGEICLDLVECLDHQWIHVDKVISEIDSLFSFTRKTLDHYTIWKNCIY